MKNEKTIVNIIVDLYEMRASVLSPLQAGQSEKVEAVSFKDDEVKKNSFHCGRCDEDFETTLGIEEAVCVRCGSSNITEPENEE